MVLRRGYLVPQHAYASLPVHIVATRSTRPAALIRQRRRHSVVEPTAAAELGPVGGVLPCVAETGVGAGALTDQFGGSGHDAEAAVENRESRAEGGALHRCARCGGVVRSVEQQSGVFGGDASERDIGEKRVLRESEFICAEISTSPHL
jgi:hypothetical protein